MAGSQVLACAALILSAEPSSRYAVDQTRGEASYFIYMFKMGF